MSKQLPTLERPYGETSRERQLSVYRARSSVRALLKSDVWKVGKTWWGESIENSANAAPGPGDVVKPLASIAGDWLRDEREEVGEIPRPNALRIE
jgi:hypothetical protein